MKPPPDMDFSSNCHPLTGQERWYHLHTQGITYIFDPKEWWIFQEESYLLFQKSKFFRVPCSVLGCGVLSCKSWIMAIKQPPLAPGVSYSDLPNFRSPLKRHPHPFPNLPTYLNPHGPRSATVTHPKFPGFFPTESSLPSVSRCLHYC